MEDIPFNGHGETPCRRHSLLEVEPGDPLRPDLERFVHAAFARAHGAEVRSFMPTLLALRGQRRLCGVVGFRLAAAEPLYLEQYLDSPAEELIAARAGVRVRREEVVEVGNLAGTSCRAACHLITLLPRYLLARERRWIVFTGTSKVRATLERMRAPVFELAAAHSECITGKADAWGRYYDADPRVMAGYIPDGLRNPAFARTLA